MKHPNSKKVFSLICSLSLISQSMSGGLALLLTPSMALAADVVGISVGDIDGDGILDASDNCPTVFNTDQADTDADGKGNVCDNCVAIANPGQADDDGDGIGNACDICNSTNPADTDLDGIQDTCDNCPLNANPDQRDSNNNGVGDVCEVGNLLGELVSPTTSLIVTPNTPFTFTSKVTCTGGNCGDVTATLVNSIIRLLIYNPNTADCQGGYGTLPLAYLTANGVNYTYWCNSNVIDASVLTNYDVFYMGRSRGNGYINSADFRNWVQNGGSAILESDGDNFEPGTSTYIWPNVYDVFGYNNCPGIGMGDNAGDGQMTKYADHEIWNGVSGTVGNGYGLYDDELNDSCIGTGTRIGTSSYNLQNPMVNQFGSGRTYSGIMTDYTVNDGSSKYFLNILRWLAQSNSEVTVPSAVGSIPFYTTSANPQTKDEVTCLGAMHDTAVCEQTWTVVPSGRQGTMYEFLTIYDSTLSAEAMTSKVKITIACDDPDGDGVCADVDNCAETYNPDQSDSDDDGLGDACDYSIHGYKWNDADGDGEDDCFEPVDFTGSDQLLKRVCDVEPRLPGWTIFLDDNDNGVLDTGEESMVTSSDPNELGWYWFENLTAGTYHVCEVPQLGWNQTYPNDPNCYEVTLPDQNILNFAVSQNMVWGPVYNFGNQYVGYCGNGIIENDEVCDGTQGVGEHQQCTATCTLETVTYCGDGIKNGSEACEGTDGVGAHQSCSDTCTLINLPYCGDGAINGTEACDDGNVVNGDGCSSTCTVEIPVVITVCGNNVKETGEECDGTDTPAGKTCSAACKLGDVLGATTLPVTGASALALFGAAELIAIGLYLRQNKILVKRKK